MAKYYKVGGTLFEVNKYIEAIERYTHAVEWDQEFSSAYFNRSLAFALLRLYSPAANDAQIVLRLEPESHDAMFVLGLLCEYQHDNDGAVMWYKMSLSVDPDYVPAMVRLRELEAITAGASKSY